MDDELHANEEELEALDALTEAVEDVARRIAALEKRGALVGLRARLLAPSPRIQWGERRSHAAAPIRWGRGPDSANASGDSVARHQLKQRRAELCQEVAALENNDPALDDPAFQAHYLRARHDLGKARAAYRTEEMGARMNEIRRLDSWLRLPEDWRLCATVEDIRIASIRDAGGQGDAARDLFMARMDTKEWTPPKPEINDSEYLLSRCVAECGGSSDAGRDLWLARVSGKASALEKSPTDMTLRMAAQLAGKHIDVLRRSIRSGELAATKKGGAYVIETNDFVGYMKARGCEPTALERNVIGDRSTWPR